MNQLSTWFFHIGQRIRGAVRLNQQIKSNGGSETIRLIINGIPPSTNVIERLHHFARQRRKDEWEQIVGWEAKHQKIIPKTPLLKCKIRLIYHFVDNRGRDPDNYNGKWTLDGLRKIRMIANDTFNHVDLKAKLGEIDRKNPHMEVVIEYEKDDPN